MIIKIELDKNEIISQEMDINQYSSPEQVTDKDIMNNIKASINVYYKNFKILEVQDE